MKREYTKPELVKASVKLQTVAAQRISIAPE
jgi:hypothetical protein